MRSILNISLQPGKKKEIEDRAQKANMTVSGYILYAVQLEEDLISEDELLEMARRAERDYKTAKTKQLKSFADLV